MSQSERKIVQYLGEAHASEAGLTRVLQAQIGMTPAGSFRNMLEKHLGETKRHGERLQRRLDELDGDSGFNPVAAGLGMAETVLGQLIALGKTPLDLVRGSGGEEKLLKNAKDDCAAEALEIATYTALERLADAAGDEVTAKLAASILAEEEQMLKRLLAEIPRLTQAVADAAFRGDPSYDITKTGAADAVRAAARTVKGTVDGGVKETKRTGRPELRHHQDRCRRRGPGGSADGQGHGGRRRQGDQADRPPGPEDPGRGPGRGRSQGRDGRRVRSPDQGLLGPDLG
ncbi:MAG: ferritin-like domain-containing protein [Actinobacteria bacterium]|nr:ferritin-like domain-containing protein [Actinomycetota bacterium]